MPVTLFRKRVGKFLETKEGMEALRGAMYWFACFVSTLNRYETVAAYPQLHTHAWLYCPYYFIASTVLPQPSICAP